ncbi:MAG: hypothetical protein ABEK75_01680 [Salinibacter sp.]
MSDTGSTSNTSFLPGWPSGQRRSLVVTGILWAAAAAIYWLGTESLAETGDLAVTAVFGALALYYFAMAVLADRATLEKQGGSCRWSWGW